MKRKIIVLIGALGMSITLFASTTAEVFDTKCAMCHIKTMPKDRSKLVAPPLMGVMRHVKMSYPKKEDAVAFIVDYVQNPSATKAVCMKQKIKRFGLMPSQKGNISQKELKEVAEWMFDNYPPSNFRGGMKKSQRLTFEMIDTNGDGMITKDEFRAFQNKRMKMMSEKRMNRQNSSCTGMMKN